MDINKDFDREDLTDAFRDMKKQISDNEIIGYKYSVTETMEGNFIEMQMLINPVLKKSDGIGAKRPQNNTRNREKNKTPKI